MRSPPNDGSCLPHSWGARSDNTDIRIVKFPAQAIDRAHEVIHAIRISRLESTRAPEPNVLVADCGLSMSDGLVDSASA